MTHPIRLLLAMLLPVFMAGPVFAADAAASAPPTHRPLRDNRPPAAPEPTEPERFTGYPGVPGFSVVPRKGQLALYPCSQCHGLLKPDATPRKLVNAPHQASLQHGKGRFWCLDCHLISDRDQLHAIGGAKIDFDRSDLLCAQCHGSRARDWNFGGHGKRVANWTGERQIYACTHCHDPHNPGIAPRAPSKPPPVRSGLSAMNTTRESAHEPVIAKP